MTTHPDPALTAIADAMCIDLASHGDAARKEWWERYLKGAVPFLGVRMAEIRSVVDAAWTDHDLDVWSTDAVLSLALQLTSRTYCEEKLLGVLVLAEHALGDLGVEHLDRLAVPLATGDVSDWNTCDWYSVKVIGPMVAKAADMQPMAEAVAEWRTAERLWQRRASAVAFVGLASQPEPYPGFRDLLFAVCSANAADPTRWSQTSVGWLLRELSDADPRRVEAFVDAHPHLSTEARRTASARL